MAFFGRKMLEKTPFDIEKNVKCLSCTTSDCHNDCGDVVVYVPSDGPFFTPPPPPTIPHVTSEKYHMPFYFILMLCVLGAFFVFICYIIILKRNRSNSRSIRRNVSQFDENREDFVIDENLGPILDHPIWYIRTVGLGEDVIDSISVFKFKKEEFLIEGTDCSVCLTEFEEDESLRLLPKCSHAFHIPCIDTWLRSHKNCPLCRAPIVSDMENSPGMDHVVEVVSSVGDDDSSPNEVIEGNDRLENLELDEEGNEETRRGVVENLDDEEGRSTMDLSMKIPRLLDGRRKGVRVFSDLVDQHRVKMNNNEVQPARRSVSMDSSAAQVIHLAMNEMNSRKMDQGCSSSKRGDKNSSLYKAMKSSSFGRSLQNVPISMKRSFSTSGKCSLQTM
ncbi:RING-H2 finger protein ATL54-like [Solanum dulcamara]|uniref:RING-H2 finger protein ATL54-like n=1 Tax=Solanum dulcamara TaxID=45834 RepID=UPI002485D211|nr:RING-H2 finger protein ATL54-like [Solanum dulcamara]